MFLPVQEYSGGIIPPIGNAGLVTSMDLPSFEAALAASCGAQTARMARMAMFAAVAVFMVVIIVRVRGFANAQGAWNASSSRDRGETPGECSHAAVAAKGAGAAGMPLTGGRALHRGNSSTRPAEGMRPAMSVRQKRLVFER